MGVSFRLKCNRLQAWEDSCIVHSNQRTRTVLIPNLFPRFPMPRLTRRDVLRSGLILSGSTLLPHAGWAQARALMQKAIDDQALPAVAPREKLLFDFGWRFAFGNA